MKKRIQSARSSQEMFLADHHTHILPGIDDGARTEQEMEELLTAAEKCGIRHIYATPHFYAHKMDVETFCQRRDAVFERVRDKTHGIRISLGAEVLLLPGLENLEGLDKLVLEGTNSLLLELPLSESLITEQHFLTVEKLAKRYHIITAHANRYSNETIEQMVEIGTTLQINASDLRRFWQRGRVRYWQEQGIELILGSDTHRDKKTFQQLGRFYKYV